MIMTEEENKLEKEVIINFIDGVACIFLPHGTVGKKLPPPKIIPFNFGTMQEMRSRNTMPDVLKDLKKMFDKNSISFSYFEIPGPKKKEDKKEDDNEERERKTDESI